MLEILRYQCTWNQLFSLAGATGNDHEYNSIPSPPRKRQPQKKDSTEDANQLANVEQKRRNNKTNKMSQEHKLELEALQKKVAQLELANTNMATEVETLCTNDDEDNT